MTANYVYIDKSNNYFNFSFTSTLKTHMEQYYPTINWFTENTSIEYGHHKTLVMLKMIFFKTPKDRFKHFIQHFYLITKHYFILKYIIQTTCGGLCFKPNITVIINHGHFIRLKIDTPIHWIKQLLSSSSMDWIHNHKISIYRLLIGRKTFTTVTSAQQL